MPGIAARPVAKWRQNGRKYRHFGRHYRFDISKSLILKTFKYLARHLLNTLM